MLESWDLKATIWLSLVPEQHVARTRVTHIFLWTTLSLHSLLVEEGLEKPLTHWQEQNIQNAENDSFEQSFSAGAEEREQVLTRKVWGLHGVFLL